MIKYVLMSIAVILVLTITIFVFEYTDIPEAVILMLYRNYTPPIAENSFVRLSTDKAVYLPGEPIRINVENLSPYILTSDGFNYGIYVTPWTGSMYPCGYGIDHTLAMSNIPINGTITNMWQPPTDPACKDMRICHHMYASTLGKDNPDSRTTLCVHVTVLD